MFERPALVRPQLFVARRARSRVAIRLRRARRGDGDGRRRARRPFHPTEWRVPPTSFASSVACAIGAATDQQRLRLLQPADDARSAPAMSRAEHQRRQSPSSSPQIFRARPSAALHSDAAPSANPFPRGTRLPTVRRVMKHAIEAARRAVLLGKPPTIERVSPDRAICEFADDERVEAGDRRRRCRLLIAILCTCRCGSTSSGGTQRCAITEADVDSRAPQLDPDTSCARYRIDCRSNQQRQLRRHRGATASMPSASAAVWEGESARESNRRRADGLRRSSTISVEPMARGEKSTPRPASSPGCWRTRRIESPRRAARPRSPTARIWNA